ncbi:MAG: hypothetical protein OXR62_12540 [Ahrensia sp.]|nr:hypothetical protein [Ahrensia sp.]
MRECEKERDKREEQADKIECHAITHPSLTINDLIEDGGGQVEVMIRLQRDLQLSAASSDPKVAKQLPPFP